MTKKEHYVEWGAAFAVAAELTRRNYDVSFTIGNTPRVDLLCAVPDGPDFKIQVKGISSANAFWVQKKFFDAPTQNNLFLVVVLVPLNQPEKPFRFFILTHGEAKFAYSHMRKLKRSGEPYKDSETGLNWGEIKNHEGRWDKFPIKVK